MSYKVLINDAVKEHLLQISAARRRQLRKAGNISSSAVPFLNFEDYAPAELQDVDLDSLSADLVAPGNAYLPARLESTQQH